MNRPRKVRVQCPRCKQPFAIAAAEPGAVVTCDNCLEEFRLKRRPRVSEHSEAGQGTNDTNSASTTSADPASVAEDASSPVPETLRVDQDLMADEYPQKPSAVLESDYEFSAACPLCGTREDVTDDRIGNTLRCRDCHTQFEVKEPSPGRRRPRGAPTADDELRLAPAVERPKPQLPPTVPVENDNEQTAGELPPVTPVAKILEKAEKEARAEAEKSKPRKLPRWPLVNGLATFLFEPGLLARWIALSIALQLWINAVIGATERLSMANAAAQFTAMILITSTILFGLILFVTIAVTALTLVRETANGNEPVRDWPSFDPADWFLESLYVGGALVACLMVTGLIARLGSFIGPMGSFVGLLAGGGISLTLLFPPLLLSALDGGSPIRFASRPVWRGIKLASGAWIRFVILSWLLLGATAFCWRLRAFNHTLGDFLAAALVLAVIFALFWLMGRIARVSQARVAERDSKLLQGASMDDGPAAKSL